MRAIVLAAGLGERMRPLTTHTPKPLLHAGGKPLIAWHLEKLAALGIKDVVINTSWLADRFAPALGDGRQWGLRLHYVYEGATPLETGGGLWNALELLTETPNAPFLAVNGDVWTDYDFARLPHDPSGDAHLVMVANPPQHPRGDFAFGDDHLLRPTGPHTLTFAGVGVYRPALFDGWREVIGDAPGARDATPRFKLAPLLIAAMHHDRVTGDHHLGRWTDVGTPQRLADLDAQLTLP